MKKKTKLIVFIMILFLFLSYLLGTAVAIYRYGKIDEKRNCDVAIILGAETDEVGVSPVYAERIHHGVWLYENGYVKALIMTGGKEEGAEFSDAWRAKEYAIRQGVPEEAIFLEEQSRITQENLEYSKRVMEEKAWDTCIVVSDPLHMKRTMEMTKDYGLSAYSSPTPTTRYQSTKTKLPFLLREEFFYIGYKIYRLLGI